MPELPEVETIVSGLNLQIIGKTIQQVKVLDERLLENIAPAALQNALNGQTIEKVERRGKFIVIVLANGCKLITHLRMTGKYLFFSTQQPAAKHTRMIVSFSDATALHYQDVRRFGRIALYYPQVEIPQLNKLGPDPFSEEFSTAYLQKKFTRYKSPIKNLLLDQNIVAGIGNIYACEILYAAKISPYRMANQLTENDLECLIQAAREILQKAIQCQGTTISDYVTANGVKGSFQECLRVYGRAKQPCPLCAGLIQRVKQTQRSTFFCPRCQG